MMEKARAESILRSALELSKSDEIEVCLGGGSYSLTRFANNTIHQNVSEKRNQLSVRSVFGKKSGKAVTNKLDPEGVLSAVRQSETAAAAQPEIPELLPMPGPQQYPVVDAFSPETASLPPGFRAEAVARAVRLCKKNGLQAAGYFSSGYGSLGGYGEVSPLAMANSRGLSAYHSGTEASFSITAMGEGSSGWGQETSWLVSNIDVEKVASVAVEKALLSSKPRQLEPGKYKVILEPAAVAELMAYMAWVGFGALQLQEGRSFMAGKVGQKVFGENISIYDDVYHDLLRGRPFDSEGMPRKRVTIAEKGVLKGPVYDRITASKDQKESTGHGLPVPNTSGPEASSVVLEGFQPVTPEELVKRTDRAILVTRFWYVNVVDPMKVVLTGMTRDGTFLVENGKIACGIRNFRFNQSVIELLSNVEAMSTPVRTGGCVVPGLLVRDFNFSSGTEF
ncbi:MAG: TldD/PmbA family protein [Candidatus Eisenbacteria bacterium]|nr:TldD/PmbA family protein [Candidatus Eisenbacteria bacterium]